MTTTREHGTTRCDGGRHPCQVPRRIRCCSRTSPTAYLPRRSSRFSSFLGSLQRCNTTLSQRPAKQPPPKPPHSQHTPTHHQPTTAMRFTTLAAALACILPLALGDGGLPHACGAFRCTLPPPPCSPTASSLLTAPFFRSLLLRSRIRGKFTTVVPSGLVPLAQLRADRRIQAPHRRYSGFYHDIIDNACTCMEASGGHDTYPIDTCKGGCLR